MVVQARQKDGNFDPAKMRTFLNQTKDWQRGFQEDLNRIKAAYYAGDVSGFSSFKPYAEAPSASPGAPAGTFVTTTSGPLTIQPRGGDSTSIKTIKEPDWAKDDGALLTKWNSYEFTKTEQLIISNPSPAGRRIYKVGAATINIAIYWDDVLSEKCRVIADMPNNPPTGTAINALRNKLMSFFGILPDTDLLATTISAEDWNAYIDANDTRKAEILYMGRLIRDLEGKTGSVIIPPKGAASVNTAGGAGGTSTTPRINSDGGRPQSYR
jgi:hypothetical protein